MEKTVAAAFWDADIPVTSLLDSIGNGRHVREQLEKLADGEGDTARELFDKVAAKGFNSDRTYIHVITNGAMEFYSGNDNGDGFNEKEAEIRSPVTGKTMRLAGGLTEFHDTYMTNGGVYHRHKNGRKIDPDTDRPYEKLGEIEAAATSPRMHRGEVIISVQSDMPFWQKPLEKMASGSQLSWSMGTTVPFDICGSCHHKAPSRDYYCEHLKEGLGGLTKEGRRILAINDRTTYHDLSLVKIPAFRIAGTLAKVAASGNLRAEFVDEDDRVAEAIRTLNPIRTAHREFLLNKLAEMEKRVDAVSTDKTPLAKSLNRTCGEETEIADKLKGIPLDSLSSLEKNNKVMLPSRSFTLILINKGQEDMPDEGSPAPSCLSEPAWLDLIPAKLPGVFSRLLESGKASAGSCCPSCGHPDADDRSKFSEALPDLLPTPDAANKRIMIRVVRPGDGEPKEASTIPEGWHKAAELAAEEYAKHQLDVLESCPQLMDLAVIQNNVAAIAAKADRQGVGR